MKDLILNFSWDRLASMPPTELLAVVVLVVFALYVILNTIFFVVRVAMGE